MPRHVALSVLVLLSLGAASAGPIPSGAPGPAPKSLQDDCLTGGDVADDADGGLVLARGQRCSGRLGMDDPADWYRVAAQAGHVLGVRTEGQSAADAYRVCGVSPAGQESCSDRAAPPSTSRFRVRADGTWAIGIAPRNAATGPYAIQPGQTGPFTWDDCGTGDDAPDAGAPAAIPATTACAGAITADGIDVVDAYGFDVPAGHRVRAAVTFQGWFPFVDVCLESPTTLLCERPYRDVTLFGDPTSAGAWTLKVSGNAVAYALDLRTEPMPDPDDCASGLDAGSTPDDALVLTLPVACRASFEPGSGDALDWYAMDVAAGDLLQVEPRTGANAHACLLAPTGETLACSNGWYPYGMPLRVQAPFEGRYHLRLESSRPWMFYDLVANVTPTGGAAQDDCGSGRDAGEHAAAATPLALDARCDATLLATSTDLSDWYAVTLAAGDDIVVNLTEPRDLVLGEICVFAPGEAKPRGCHDTGAPDRKRFELHADAGGQWLVRVTRDTASDYSLVLTRGALQDDCGSGRDAGATRAGAVPLGAAAACLAAFPPLLADHEDWYAVTATAGAAVVAQWVMQPLFTMEVCLHAPGGAQVACARDGRVAATAQDAGTWHVVARRVIGTGAYELAVGAA